MPSPSPKATGKDAAQERRRDAMAALASSDSTELAQCLQSIEPLPPYENLRVPESGLVMLRGRIGGDGAPFNLGEATVSRAAVRLASGEVGYGYVLGRDGGKARMIAICDALIQTEAYQAAVEFRVVQPIRERLETARAERARLTAATKVDFFTLVRGEG